MPTLKLAMFGGNEASVDPGDGGLVVTVFGVTQLRRPTLAAQIRRRVLETRAGRPTMARRTSVVTVVGFTKVRSPTLAAELVEMIQLQASHLVAPDQLAALAHAAVGQGGGDLEIRFWSVLGAAVVRRRALDEERAALRAAVDAGLLPPRFAHILRTPDAVCDGRALALHVVSGLHSDVDPYRGALEAAGPRLAAAPDPDEGTDEGTG